MISYKSERCSCSSQALHSCEIPNENAKHRMDTITEGIRTTHLGDGPEMPDQLIFNSQDNSKLDLAALYTIPRYLFRIVSPLSDGRMDSTWVRSQAACQNTRSSREDVFSAWNNNRRSEIASTLNLHLRWWPKGDLEDNFVSWTSSLLFAIQYIYYRHQHPRDASSLDDIDLYVIDTTQFPPGTFLRDLDLIKAFLPFDTPQEKNLKDLLTLREKPNFYFGEYLSQGSLKIEGKCQRISAATLFENDALYRLQPEFGATSNPPPGAKVVWVKEVNRLRDSLYQQQGRLSMQEMSNRLEAVGELSGHFPPGWQFPLAIYFAGLISHDSVTEDEEIGSDNVFFAYFRSSSFYGLCTPIRFKLGPF